MKEQQEKLVGEGHTVTSQDLRISTLKSRSADKGERDIQSPVKTSRYLHSRGQLTRERGTHSHLSGPQDNHT
jgi:hypothetical protein